MKRISILILLTTVAFACFLGSAFAQYSLPPGSSEEVVATYNTAIENRTATIMTSLKLGDAGKSARVHDIVIAQYRTLKAREEAIDGGSAGEKSAIFQKYKDQINDYLNAHGHDVAKAYKEWESKQQATVSKSPGEPAGQNAPAANK
jgi:hypothetical protein